MEEGKSGACSRIISAPTTYIEAAAARQLYHSLVLLSRVAETCCFLLSHVGLFTVCCCYTSLCYMLLMLLSSAVVVALERC